MSLSVIKELISKWLKNSLTAFNIAMTPIMIVLSVVAYTVTESSDPTKEMLHAWIPVTLYLGLFLILVFCQRLYPKLEEWITIEVDTRRYHSKEIAIRIRGAELRLEEVERLAKEGKLQ